MEEYIYFFFQTSSEYKFFWFKIECVYIEKLLKNWGKIINLNDNKIYYTNGIKI